MYQQRHHARPLLFSIDNYMINRNARLRDEEVLRSLRARYKEIPQEIMDYILNK
jgi:hypothetical protein